MSARISKTTLAPGNPAAPAAPHVPGADPAGNPEAAETHNLSQSTILIVDDNAQNVELLQAYLEALPCRTITATDGIEAIKLIDAALAAPTPAGQAKPLPDLILLDVMMPRMSGFEVCKKLKDDPATRSVPIIMVTALNELGDIERGVESGTDDFISKPVDKLTLLTRVKSLLRVRHLKRELDRTMAYIEDIQTRPHIPHAGMTGGSPAITPADVPLDDEE
ncbi:MAG: response regulator [Planctomycetes bacterium]|nr:response regulator [Planctomycetota bacterium]